MTERHLIRRGKTNCPKCDGYKGIMGTSPTGHPATLVCPRCGGSGELWEDSLTEAERNVSPKVFYERSDNP